MSRLAPLDRALVLILVPLWVICFGLGVRNQVRGGPLAVSGLGLMVEDAESYPALTGEFFRAVHPSDPLVEAGLLVGDRVIQGGGADMRGVGSMLAFSEDFEKRPDVPIRGRRETQDVYALPMQGRHA